MTQIAASCAMRVGLRIDRDSHRSLRRPRPRVLHRRRSSRRNSPSRSRTTRAARSASARSAAAGAMTGWSGASWTRMCRRPASRSACRGCRRRSPRSARSTAATQAGPVVVLVLDRDRIGDYQRMVADLRKADIAAELYLGDAGMRAQMKYADRRNAPLAIIQGGDEKARGVVQIKDLALGKKLSAGDRRQRRMARGAAGAGRGRRGRPGRGGQPPARPRRTPAAMTAVAASADPSRASLRLAARIERSRPRPQG